MPPKQGCVCRLYSRVHPSTPPRVVGAGALFATRIRLFVVVGRPWPCETVPCLQPALLLFSLPRHPSRIRAPLHPCRGEIYIAGDISASVAGARQAIVGTHPSSTAGHLAFTIFLFVLVSFLYLSPFLFVFSAPFVWTVLHAVRMLARVGWPSVLHLRGWCLGRFCSGITSWACQPLLLLT